MIFPQLVNAINFSMATLTSNYCIIISGIVEIPCGGVLTGKSVLLDFLMQKLYLVKYNVRGNGGDI